MKKITLLSAVATLGLLGLSASAKIPEGYTSAKIKLTAYIQGDGTYTKVKVTTKDILSLVGDEFGTLPDGAQLVTDGLGSGELTVLDKNGDVDIADASESEDADYYLYYDYDGTYVVNYKESSSKETDTYITDYGYLTYQSADEDDSFTVGGLTTGTDTYTDAGNKESFKGTGWSGTFSLEDIDEGYGVLSGTVSGSGKDVDTIDD